MYQTVPPSPSVVVGIDGSRGAVDAALWAAAEAVDRDIPLRLVYAIEPRESVADSRSVAQAFAAAESAVRYAAMAVESLNQPVKIEVEIIQDRPVAALLAASNSAAMVCVGALGVNRATGRRAGSTLSALVARSHCPVTVVRQQSRRTTETGWVVTEFDASPEGAVVLGHAVDEARLRMAPLRVLTSELPGVERSLERYRRLYPDLSIQAVAWPGSTSNYRARHAASIQLLVLGHHPDEELSQVNCSVLLSERHGAL
jgi:nucleotide-binding universal stress UspA family protein